MLDFQNLKYCTVAKILFNQSRFSKTKVTMYSFSNDKISGELIRCNSFWMYPPLWSSPLVAMHNDIENTSVANVHGTKKIVRIIFQIDTAIN